MFHKLQGRGTRTKAVPERTTERPHAEGDRSSMRPNPQDQTFVFSHILAIVC